MESSESGAEQERMALILSKKWISLLAGKKNMILRIIKFFEKLEKTLKLLVPDAQWLLSKRYLKESKHNTNVYVNLYTTIAW